MIQKAGTGPWAGLRRVRLSDVHLGVYLTCSPRWRMSLNIADYVGGHTECVCRDRGFRLRKFERGTFKLQTIYRGGGETRAWIQGRHHETPKGNPGLGSEQCGMDTELHCGESRGQRQGRDSATFFLFRPGRNSPLFFLKSNATPKTR